MLQHFVFFHALQLVHAGGTCERVDAVLEVQRAHFEQLEVVQQLIALAVQMSDRVRIQKLMRAVQRQIVLEHRELLGYFIYGRFCLDQFFAQCFPPVQNVRRTKWC